MLELYNLATQTSCTESEFRAAHENISFPAILSKELLAEYGAVAVLASPQPVATDFQSVQRDGVIQDALGNYVQAWKIVDWDQSQIDSFITSSLATKWESIKAERERRAGGGFKVVVDGVDKWFHSDSESRIKHLGLVLLGTNIPAGLQWKTMDGTFVAMTSTIAQEVFSTAAQVDTTIFAKAEWHKTQVEQLAASGGNPATYDFSQGWPTIYGE